MLAARTRRAEGVNAQIFHVQRKVHLFGLRHHGHGGRRSMDAALRLRLGYTLHPVDAALVLEAVVGAPAIDRKDSFLGSAELRLVEVQQLHLPAPALDVHGVHPHEVVGEQRSFLAAGTGAYLHDDAFLVVYVLRQQQNFEIIFQLCHILTFFAQFLLYHSLKVRVEGLVPFQQGFRLCQVVLRSGEGVVSVHHRLCFMVLLHQAAELRRVGGSFGLIETDRKFFEPAADGLHLGSQIRHIRQFSLQNSF